MGLEVDHSIDVGVLGDGRGELLVNGNQDLLCSPIELLGKVSYLCEVIKCKIQWFCKRERECV